MILFKLSTTYLGLSFISSLKIFRYGILEIELHVGTITRLLALYWLRDV